MTAWCDMMRQIKITIKIIWTCQHPLCCCSFQLFLPIWSNSYYLLSKNSGKIRDVQCKN